MTIVRIWRGVTLATGAGRYLEYLNNFVAPAYRTAEGNEGMLIMQELQNDLAHFLLLSFWTSEETLKNFAGVDCCEVVVPSPEEKEFLIAFESTARHYSIVYKSIESRQSISAVSLLLMGVAVLNPIAGNTSASPGEASDFHHLND